MLGHFIKHHKPLISEAFQLFFLSFFFDRSSTTFWPANRYIESEIVPLRKEELPFFIRKKNYKNENAFRNQFMIATCILWDIVTSRFYLYVVFVDSWTIGPATSNSYFPSFLGLTVCGYTIFFYKYYRDFCRLFFCPNQKINYVMVFERRKCIKRGRGAYFFPTRLKIARIADSIERFFFLPR